MIRVGFYKDSFGRKSDMILVAPGKRGPARRLLLDADKARLLVELLEEDAIGLRDAVLKAYKGGEEDEKGDGSRGEVPIERQPPNND